MKTLYKVAIALGVTEYTYFFLSMLNLIKNNTIDLQSVIIIAILGLSGFSCFYIQSKRDALVSGEDQ